MPKEFIQIEDLFVEYMSDGQVIHAVNGVSLQVKEGETLGLVGETGAGKTTIAKAIMRVLPEPPAKVPKGRILLEGQDILTIPEKQMRKLRGSKVSMIFQDPMTTLNPVMTVGKQIAEVIEIHEDCSAVEAMKKAADMMEMVGIPAARFDEYPHQFSGGMKQRIVIAIALACNPRLLLADEPTTALDVTIQAQVLDLIKDLQERMHTAMILITHDLGVVAQTCENVAVIYAGQIVEYGSRRDVFKSTSHPYTKGLFASVPHLNDEEPRLHPITGLPPDPSNLPAGCAFAPRCPYATQACHTQAQELKEVSEGHYCRCMMAEASKAGLV